MRTLQREGIWLLPYTEQNTQTSATVDPVVFKMLSEDPGTVTYDSVGGLNEQIRELREVLDAPFGGIAWNSFSLSCRS